jgi:hypothetical protein
MSSNSGAETPVANSRGAISAKTPYSAYQGTETWNIVEKAIRDLIRNNDIAELTSPENIVGYICQQLESHK